MISNRIFSETKITRSLATLAFLKNRKLTPPDLDQPDYSVHYDYWQASTRNYSCSSCSRTDQSSYDVKTYVFFSIIQNHLHSPDPSKYFVANSKLRTMITIKPLRVTPRPVHPVLGANRIATRATMKVTLTTKKAVMMTISTTQHTPTVPKTTTTQKVGAQKPSTTRAAISSHSTTTQHAPQFQPRPRLHKHRLHLQRALRALPQQEHQYQLRLQALERTPEIITNFELKPEIPRIISINNKEMIVFALYRLLFRKAWRTELPFRRAPRRNFARVALKKVPAKLSFIAPTLALKNLTNNVPLNHSSVS